MKIKLAVVFTLSMFFYKFSICQIEYATNNPIENNNVAEKLLNEIKQINNSESFVLFLLNHAATYEDFDSLYAVIENKPCPQNYTYKLVNGDSSVINNVGKSFLYLIDRNFFQGINVDKTKIKSISDISGIDCFYNNLASCYAIIKPHIKNQLSFSIDSMEIKEVIINNHTNGYLTVKNNFKSWKNALMAIDIKERNSLSLKHIDNDKKNIDFKLARKLSIYYIKYKGIWENSFWNKITNQDESFLENDLGGSIIAKNISRYISAQVFGDIGFVFINNKIILIDLDR